MAGENSAAGCAGPTRKEGDPRQPRSGPRTMIEALPDLKKAKSFSSPGQPLDSTVTDARRLDDRDKLRGETFLSGICREWESNRGVRKNGDPDGSFADRDRAIKDGGAMATMLTAVQTGCRRRYRSGRQWMSWISLDDVVAIINFALENESVSRSCERR